MTSPIHLDRSAPPTFIDRSSTEASQPTLDPAAALPTMPYSMGIGDSQLLAAIDAAKQAPRQAALAEVQMRPDQVLARMGDMVAPNTVARAAYEAVQSPQGLQMYPGGEAPAQIGPGHKGDMAALAREAGFSIPQLSEITGQNQQVAQQAQVIAFTPTQTPPPPPAPPAPTALEAKLDGLTSAMGALVQFQQQQIAAQQGWQAQQAQLEAQRQATAWMDPAFQDAELVRAGVDPNDPVAAPVARLSLKQFYQYRSGLEQMQAQMSQLATQVGQVASLYSGLQSQAQAITTGQQLQTELQSQLRGTKLNDRTFSAVQQNALKFLQMGASPSEAAQQALAPLMLQMATPQPPTPPMIPALQQNVLNAMAHRGGGAGPQGAAPALNNSAVQLGQNLAALDNIMANLLGRG